MLRCTAKIKGMAPLSYGKALESQKKSGESDDALDARAWRERMHINKDGNIFLPGMALANGLWATAKYLSETIKGKGKATWTKHFLQGILIVDDITVTHNGKPIPAESVEGERLFVPSDGVKGSGKRVWRTFPTVPQWEASFTFYVVDQLLVDKPQKIEEYVKHMGMFNGFGRWAKRVGGMYGLFSVEGFEYEEVVDMAA